jgi:hypothetical protein
VCFKALLKVIRPAGVEAAVGTAKHVNPGVGHREEFAAAGRLPTR